MNCGAGNLAQSFRAGRVVECTLPAGHPVWTLHANGYSYNHGDAEAGVWWNEATPPPGVDKQEWLNGGSNAEPDSAPATSAPTGTTDHAWECPKRHWDYRQCTCDSAPESAS